MKTLFPHFFRVTSFVMGIAVLCGSCSSSYRMMKDLQYQSVRVNHEQPTKDKPYPESAVIIASYYLTLDGKIAVGIANNTDSIMLIDNTKSYFISNGQSTSYYDPTVRTSSTTNLSSSTSGVSVNLGSIAAAVGVRGFLGTALSGVNVGGSGTSGSSTTNTTYTADQPTLSIGPHGAANMPHVYAVSGVGNVSETRVDMTKTISPKKFAICISYSIDNGKNYHKMVTEFYVNAEIVQKIESNEKYNEAVRNLLQTKPDAFGETWWWLKANQGPYPYQTNSNLFFYDYQ